MTMEKRNVVSEGRTPEHEITRTDDDWDKHAADAFEPVAEPASPDAGKSVVPTGEHRGDEN